MSQSDYLRHKKTGILLNEPLPPILSSQDYSRYTAYNLETKMININQTYNETTNDHTMQIYDLNVRNEICGDFPCEGTNARPNRRPLLAYQSTCFPVMKAPGLSVHKVIDKEQDNLSKSQCECIKHTKKYSIIRRINCC